MLIATFIVLGLLARALYLAHWLRQTICIRSARSGLWGVELRRRVGMQRLPCHVSEYPVPREERILVNRVLGLVLWHREVSVALPDSASEHLDAVGPQEFDGQFPAWLRVGSKPA